MKKFFSSKPIVITTSVILLTVFIITSSFKAERVYGDFLSQLGIPKDQANSKINSGFLSGFFDYYGIRNLKNIALSNRAAIAKDVVVYAKEYVHTDAFKKEYAALKQRRKPQPQEKLQTPQEMRNNMVKMAEEFVKSSEENLKKATPATKSIFEEAVKYSKENLKKVTDPKDESMKLYEQNYPTLVKQMQESYESSIKEWQAAYPEDYMPMIKARLQEFLKATDNIDFNAPLVEKNGKKYFVNREYERKDSQWKLAFRAGKETVEAARAGAQQWLSELK